jgi:Flp pilus assembly protein TadD
MERILIRHLSGARAGQVDEFPAAETNEILVGRDPEASVRFDPSREDLVSRQHVKIVRDPESTGEFAVVDLQSRNGTFLNRQRVYAPARVTHNDVIQLGPAGPEFRFEIDPPPMLGIARPPATGTLLLAPVHEDSAPRPIGRATVERMLGDTFTKVKHESDKAVWVGAAALTAILVVGGVIYMYQRRSAAEAGLEAQQNQQLMQQMGQDVKKTPEMAEAMRQEVARLNDQLKLSDVRSEERLRRLSQQVAAEEAITKEAVRELEDRQPSPALPPAQQPPATPASTPASNPAPAPARDTSVDTKYPAQIRHAVDLLQSGDAAGALRVAQQLIQSEPDRWEAYSVAASVARVQSNPAQAKSMFEKALSLAPDDVKPGLRAALEEIARGQ